MDSRSFFSVTFLGFWFICGVDCFDSLMDNVYFDIKWPGPEESLQMTEENKNQLTEDSSVFVMTNKKEKYRCIIPTVLESDQKETDDTASNALELDLLKPLFEQSACTYRLETYWTYELCHGRHLRQYHEEKEMGKKPKLQEYFLGRYKMETFNSDYETAKQNQLKSDDKKQSASRKIQKVQGIEIPYYEVVYTDGTLCELTGQPRKSFLHYVCQPDGRGEVYELKETSSCEYEVVVLASQLCSHPAYGPKKEQTNTIHCHALDGSPKRPQNLELFNLESTFEQFNGRQYWEDETSEKEDSDPINSLWDLVGQIIKELDPNPEPDVSQPATQKPQSEPTQAAMPTRPPPSNNLIQKEFFEGSFCIEGGAGWWKHKFCYGKHVMQFHIDTIRRDFIVLGEWNEEAHLRWINANSWKRPRPVNTRKFISQLYSDGDVCEITGKRRSVEVKLRCISNPEHPNSVAIFLSEPRTCEYLLVVESPILCELIAQADDNGLIVNPKL